MQIEPEDTCEAVLMALRLQSEPVVLLLPEQSQAFSDPSHFAQLRQVCTPDDVSFVVPTSRIGTLAHDAHQHGFAFASSVEKAVQLLPAREEHQAGGSQETVASPIRQGDDDAQSTSRVAGEDEHEVDEGSGQLVTPLSESPSLPPSRTSRKRSGIRRLGLIATLMALLVVGGAVLLPALFSAQPGLMGVTQPAAPQALAVGQIAFASSGQLDPHSSTGLNDTVTLSLHDLAQPASGKSDEAWLLPDPSDDTTKPLLLGKLSIMGGKAQLTYVQPDHEDLLASYSRFEVAEQDSQQTPTTPPLDPAAWRYVGSIPDLPTPGDEQQYSLLDHLRHLLATDPTLQQLGLQGGLDIWLYRNTGKIWEWSSAARDNWAGGQQTALIHRHMLRVLEYLDGTASVSTSGDLPLDAPVLVDPQAGRIGLLEVSPTQALPAYLTHVDIHLQGLTNAPGHTQAQKQLAITIDKALKQVTFLMQNIHQDAVKLVKMNDEQLKSHDALTLLNDMVTNATNAYAGQFDPAIGGNTNGVVWIHNELQGLATMPVTVATAKKP